MSKNTKSNKLEPITPPTHFDFDVEKSLLGSILVSSGHTIKIMDDLSGILTHEMFFDPTHQQIFFAMMLLWKSEIEISTISVLEIIRETENELGIDQKTLLMLAAKNSLLGESINGAQIIKKLYTERNIITLAERIIYLAKTESQMESNLLEIQNELDKFTLQKENIKIKSADQLFENYIEDKLNQKGKPLIQTGIKAFDDNKVGLQGGAFVVLAARPKVGKTSLSLVMSNNLVKQNLNVLYFSLEMTEAQIRDKLTAYEAGVNPIITKEFGKAGSEGSTKKYQEIISNAVSTIKKSSFNTAFSYNLDIWQLEKTALLSHKKKPLDVIMIDQLSKIGTKGIHKNKIEQYTFITNKLKELALRLDIPVVLLHQLSRAADGRDNKIPQMSDLKDCSSLEEDADLIFLMAKDDKKTEKQVQVSVINRDGSACEVELDWSKTLARVV